MNTQAHFDQFAETYDSNLEQALSISGEDGHYFARRRITYLALCLRQLRLQPSTVMDYGCGTGSSSELFRQWPTVESFVGIDVSPRSIDVARSQFGSARCRFAILAEYQPCEKMDLVYCNGVFHHIPPDERRGALNYIYRSLHPGGVLALWENNPWNPGTRLVMARCVFDRDAIPLRPVEAIHLIQSAGFEVLRKDFLFIFPRPLGWLRRIEPLVSKLPLGAQYQVLCRKTGKPS